jgi:pantoate--beta-alanine ligase
MILFKQAEKISDYLHQQQKLSKKIGFVPTMGALHNGHLSLISASKKNNDLTVCSIFVNPTQFNNQEDFKNYPVTIESDIEKLLAAECDVLFIPLQAEIYAPNFVARHYDLGKLEDVLEGFYRPGHFQGVCQVVDRLLEIIQPHNLYLGAKDFQQCKVIGRLLEITGKQKEINLNIEPTLRENDGLAMSSRNLRLHPEQRKIATSIYEALTLIKENNGNHSISEMEKQASTLLLDKGFQPDYVHIADATTLLPADETTEKKIALIAAFLGDVRLIDNLPLN